MRRDTKKPAGEVADAKLFDDWSDLIETDLRAKVRDFIETTTAEASDQLSRPSRPHVQNMAATYKPSFAPLDDLDGRGLVKRRGASMGAEHLLRQTLHLVVRRAREQAFDARMRTRQNACVQAAFLYRL